MWWLFPLLCLIFPHSIVAQGEFTTREIINYTVNPNLTTSVSQITDISNKFSQIYLQEYVVKLQGNNLSQIKATDSLGNIVKKIETKEDLTTIYLKFNQPAIGKNKTTHFELNYLITDFVHTKGKTYEVQLPDFHSSSDSHDIELQLQVPQTFGAPSFASVNGSIYYLNQTITIAYKSVQNSQKPILVVFGNHQLFDFQLKYFLKNDSHVPIKTEIALPPDTFGQNVIYQSISPRPLTITVDPDGNWLAQYLLPADSIIDIQAIGQVKITPPLAIPLDFDQSQYLSAQKYWETINPSLITTAATLKTPQDIYNFVINTLSYNYQKIDSAIRTGAVAALSNPRNSLCSEFTDLFVTLARIKGIPAREIEGFAYSNNPKIKPINTGSDILHAWPQYYDSKTKGWISVDPTWEKTTNGIDFFHTLDLNHFTFVIHGLESDYPPPPGSYKKNPQQRSVTVDFASQEITPPTLLPGLSLNQRTLTVTNPNLFQVKDIKLAQNSWQTTISIPPLGTATVSLPPFSLLDYLNPATQKQTFLLTLPQTGTTTSIRVVNKNYFLVASIVLFGLTAILSLGGIILTVHKTK